MPALVLAVLISIASSESRANAALLFEGGTVYVAADAKPRKASILVRGARIEFVGATEEARRLGGGANRVDLTGAYVFPGWADAHGHLLGLGKSLEVANLRGAATAAEAASRIRVLVERLPRGGAWAEARGWDQNLWPGKTFPDARDLDAAVPDRPVAARRVDGHALWLNSRALELAGIGRDTRDPEGGRILRRPDGTPSGVLVDNAMDVAERAIPAPSPGDLARWLLAGARACVRVGLTQVQDASGYGPAEVAALEALAARGELPLRVYATVSPEAEHLAKSYARGTRIGDDENLLTVRAIKAYADGALGSRGAALLADYSDEPGKRGLLVTSPERLDAIARESREKGWQLWIHAIGDRGNRVALDAFRRAAAAVPSPQVPSRARIEHAQVVAVEDIPRFARDGVIASIQPTHATSDMRWAEARVGPQRIRGAYAWRSLVNAKARLAGGSDFPVESENPLLGLYAAVTRRDPSGNPPGGWRGSERLTRKEALALFTSDAAYAAYEEDRRGRIVSGRVADLTVLSADPMTVAEGDIPGVGVRMTVVAGRVVHPAGEKP